jgi:hypothetical protein
MYAPRWSRKRRLSSTGADAMQGKSKTTPAAGAAQTVGAVNQYGRYFQHPGWKPID